MRGRLSWRRGFYRRNRLSVVGSAFTEYRLPKTPSGNNLHPHPAPTNFRSMADLSSLFQLAQQAQGRLSEIQTKLAQETITAQAGGGMVKTTADGGRQIRSMKI